MTPTALIVTFCLSTSLHGNISCAGASGIPIAHFKSPADCEMNSTTEVTRWRTTLRAGDRFFTAQCARAQEGE